MMRESLNLRSTPRDRPVIWQRLRERVGLASRGSFASAAKFFAFLSCRRRSAYFLTSASRRFCFATQALVAISSFLVGWASRPPRIARRWAVPTLLFRLLAERHPELLQQLAPFIRALGRRHHRD